MHKNPSGYFPSPICAKSLAASGDQKYALKEYSAAIVHYDRAIIINAKNAAYFYKRALARQRLDQYETAIIDYDKAIELNPDNAKHFHHRGIAKSQIGQHEAAITDHNKAIELDANNAEYFHSRGRTYYQLKEPERAITDYSQSITLETDNDDYFNSRGHAYYMLKKYEEAVADYKQAIKIDPNSAIYFYNRGDAYAELQEHEAATADYTQAINMLKLTYIPEEWWLAFCKAMQKANINTLILDFNKLDKLTAKQWQVFSEALKSSEIINITNIKRKKALADPRLKEMNAILRCNRQELTFTTPSANFFNSAKYVKSQANSRPKNVMTVVKKR